MSNPSSHQLTITGGDFRGRKLVSPAVATTHPMGSREKMALFNSLVSLIGPLKGVEIVLDSYCGSGALGLEALSRGAKRAVFVDQNVSALESTKENIAALGVSDRAEVIKSSIENLGKSSVSWAKYDLILVDPPYADFPDNLSNLADLLAPQGILVLSHPTSVSPEAVLPDLRLISTKSYAAANLSYFRHP